MKNLTLSPPTIKAVINPTPNSPNSEDEIFCELLSRSSPEAATIVGTAKRKENSTIVFRFNPSAKPPIIVAAERETPGTIASAWKRPMYKHCL